MIRFFRTLAGSRGVAAVLSPALPFVFPAALLVALPGAALAAPPVAALMDDPTPLQAAAEPQQPPAAVLPPAPPARPAQAAPQAPQPAPGPDAPSVEGAAPADPSIETAPQDVDADDNDDIGPRRRQTGAVRFGQDFMLSAGDITDDVVVIGGTATIAGHVMGDLVVIGGAASFASTALVDGDTVIIGGNVRVDEGAMMSGDAVVVGGRFDAPPGFKPGGEEVLVGLGEVGSHLGAVMPWLSRGLFWGRLFVPDLPWNWFVALAAFLLYVAIIAVAENPVQRCVSTLDTKPVTAFMVGLLVLLLAGPALGLLVISIVGVIIVPFALVAMFVAFIVGRVTVAEWLGLRILRPSTMEGRMTPILALAIGFAILCLLYMVPIIGLLMWGMVGVLGIGAVVLATSDAYRAENPRPTPRHPGTVPPIPNPAFPDAGVAGAAGAAQMAATSVAGDAVSGLPPHAGSSGGFAPAAAFAGAEFAGTDPSAAAPPFTPVPPFATAPQASSYAVPFQDMAAYPRASFAERLAAFALDVLLVFLLVAFINGEPDGVFIPLFLAYRIGAWTWKSATLGGVICQLRVTRADGTRLTFADALIRGLSSIFSIIVLGLGCFWVLRDEERQAWHDRVAGTYVVKVPRNFPL
jgi:uncharacterized RDD family membrane protein YckC